MRLRGNLPRRVDSYDGQPLPRLWIMDIDADRKKLPVLGIKARKRTQVTGTTYDPWPNCRALVWCGQWKGYGRDAEGKPLFRNLQTALAFAVAAYKAGYRVKARGK